MQKLREMTENNHPHSSLSEAHNDLLQLCNLASLAARARERQIVLASDWYQQTLLRIIPREYKPMATSLVESCGNYNGEIQMLWEPLPTKKRTMLSLHLRVQMAKKVVINIGLSGGTNLGPKA